LAREESTKILRDRNPLARIDALQARADFTMREVSSLTMSLVPQRGSQLFRAAKFALELVTGIHNLVITAEFLT